MDTMYKVFDHTNYLEIPNKIASPKKGKYWRNIPHTTMIETVQTSMEDHGWQFHNLEVILNPSETDMQAVWVVDPYSCQSPYGMFLCLRCSHSGRYASRLFMGVSLPDEDDKPAINIPTLEQFLGKSTARIANTMQDTIDESLEGIHLTFPSCLNTINRMGRSHIPPMTAARIVGQAANMKMMPWSRIGKFNDIYSKGVTFTAWRFLVSFCETILNNPPLKQMEESYKFYCLLKDSL